MASSTRDVDSLKKLKDLLLMLDPSSTPDSEKKSSSLLRLLTKASRQHSDYFQQRRPYRSGSTIVDIVPRFVELLRECLLSHEWPKALKLVEVLSREMQSSDTTVWKVGTACLLQMGEAKSRLLQQFVKQVSALRSVAVVEVLVEYLLYLLTEGNLADAKDLIRDLKKNTRYNVDLSDPKRQAAQTLFDSYQGLILYARWKQAIIQQNTELPQEDAPFSQTCQIEVAREDPKAIATAAIDCLTPLRDKPGVWDIFISRVVEMQMTYGAVEDARMLLQDYANRDPHNPNSHRYLYQLELRTSGRPEVKEKHLKDLIKLDPCNPHVIDLYHLEEDQPSSVSLLFDYLDYDHCSNDHTVLGLLLSRLEQIDQPGNSRLKKEVKHCWKSRSDWWPASVLREASGKRSSHHLDNDGQDSDTDSNSNIGITSLKRKIYAILRNL